MNISMHHIANVYRTYDAAVTMCLCNIPDQHSDLPVPGPKTKPQSGNSSVCFSLISQGSHWLEKYLNIQDCLEKFLKIKFALKVLEKHSKALKSP